MTKLSSISPDNGKAGNFTVQMPRTPLILLFLFSILIALFILPFASWLIADEGIAATSGSDFCVDCHSMEPMEEAYLRDVHGGNTSHGVMVQCVECHLDHSSSAAYFFDKVRTGTHDVWVENTQDTHAIDWQAKREHRESFTYDTGCLHCHENLQQATKANTKAFVAHKPYFLGDIDDKCVTCHEHVGHKGLDEALQAHEERYQREQAKASK